VQSLGGGTPASITFPVTGVTNWTPYAEEIKSKGIKGFTFCHWRRRQAARS
jgi:hypothetical protein